ncbi:MAG: HPr family phosphocarrier protein [Clostridiaceae bacterium]|uniref:HPr family phosphocarrier protein n=1 Tax=Clostridium porci TaxID=2605778 RepID=A0A7X2TBH3_9CLOT|nr:MULTISPECIES: HPr family phosphocarrier protein [Clostridium]MCI6139068.1 HPr family phosphocarrier protein [Clostridium sp.]MDU3396041.1 HPr family phosphocarrier protein [Clostridiales bacterium]MDY3230784.1 HPr family phosphocarrier protein [Clostridiaceae bacterium]MSS35470.1 HPr family phosphocarrier protein [Clostridium porci]
MEDVKEFVNTVSKIEGDATLSGGRYIVDAKSIMGIFSLDLTKQLKQDMVSCF